MTYKKVGGIHFMTIGRLGVNFYVKKAKSTKPVKQQTITWLQRFAMSYREERKLLALGVIQ